jgi:hypothetical protein
MNYRHEDGKSLASVRKVFGSMTQRIKLDSLFLYIPVLTPLKWTADLRDHFEVIVEVPVTGSNTPTSVSPIKPY